jgi:hypothetical protein
MMEPSKVAIAETDTPLSQYQYQPIEPKYEIRIRILLPPASPHESEIHCEIAAARFSDGPSYEAISYCWGAEAFPDKIHLSTGTLAVIENLAAGLRRLRLEDRSRRLWVDALCINQHGDEEKGHQVALMANIYRNAECVLVWLGEGNQEAHTGIERIRELASSAWKYGLQYDDLFNKWQEVESKLAGGPDAITAALAQLSSQVKLHTINAFFTQDWFQRLWVVQEYVSASRVEFYNGINVLTHQELSLAVVLVFVLLRLSNPTLEHKEDFEEIVMMILQRGSSHILKPLKLLTLLRLYYRRLYTLDHDRIYALSALASADPGSELEVDYSVAVGEVSASFGLFERE